MTIFEQILKNRGIKDTEDFLNPNYEKEKGDPFLLPDMQKAVERLKKALENDDKIVIYGDYDIDGLSATTLLLDAFSKFGFKKIDAFIPNRFVEGYGMTKGAVDKVQKMGADLIVTVDCGSLCHEEIAYANELGIDTIVTDHHNVADTPPPAVASINPKFSGHKYPFIDLAGVGVAFKLVQAMQESGFEGIEDGYEKWFLDLVALGTVCDIVSLKDENRANVYWGLKVMQKQHRLGLKYLMQIASVDPNSLNTRSLGFGIGPRINAAGRLETAKLALDMMVAKDKKEALKAAGILEEINIKRRSIQDNILKEAKEQAKSLSEDDVLVVSGKNWNHGVIGIVASKLVEEFKKPTYILEEKDNGTATGSARSFGDFSAADAIRYCDDIIIKGGGHAAAAGVTLSVDRIDDFRKKVNEFYKKKKFNPKEQLDSILPKADVVVDDFSQINEDLVDDISKLEPFGNTNPEPVLKINNATIVSRREMGSEGQHLKLKICDKNKKDLEFLAFNADKDWYLEPGEIADIYFKPTINEWRGNRNVEGVLAHLEVKR